MKPNAREMAAIVAERSKMAKRDNEVTVWQKADGVGPTLILRGTNQYATVGVVCTSGTHDKTAFAVFDIQNTRETLRVVITQRTISTTRIPKPRKATNGKA